MTSQKNKQHLKQKQDMNTKSLPKLLYTKEQSREIDRIAIEDHKVPSFTLMTRAATMAYSQFLEIWSKEKKIYVICGIGNNGGDGFLFARLAHLDGHKVKISILGEKEKIKGDAKLALEQVLKENIELVEFNEKDLSEADVVIDAVFGTGLERGVSGIYFSAFELINNNAKEVYAIDIPSGLDANTGRIMGIAIKAKATITFITLKQGLFTNYGPDYAGEVFFDDLQVPREVLQNQVAPSELLDWDTIKQTFPERPKNSHKGLFGHSLLVGGNKGMFGAVILAAKAAFTIGSGLTSVATRHDHASLIPIHQPEIMSHGCESKGRIDELLTESTVCAIGPGLGQDKWAETMFSECFESSLPLIVDADALNILALNPIKRGNWILTPHPGEAARLLKSSTSTIQNNRFEAVKELQSLFGGTIILKGCGSLICSDSQLQNVSICPYGNPAMASAGMGDTLTGILAGLVAQGLTLDTAAKLGTCLHAKTGDYIAYKKKRRVVLASAIIKKMHKII